jgi:hypothetical protein
MHTQIHIFVILATSKYLKLLFHMYMGYIIGYIQIFNSIFLTDKCDFLNKNKQTKSLVSGSQKISTGE